MFSNDRVPPVQWMQETKIFHLTNLSRVTHSGEQGIDDVVWGVLPWKSPRLQHNRHPETTWESAKATGAAPRTQQRVAWRAMPFLQQQQEQRVASGAAGSEAKPPASF